MFQVETIGDAYMVVGGLQEYVETHADQVVAMAMGMIDATTGVLSTLDNQPIQVGYGGIWKIIYQSMCLN